jgi:hypothetical protein
MDLKNTNATPEIQQQHITEPVMQQTTTTTLSIDFNSSLPLINYNKELEIEIKSNKPLSGKQHLLLIPITKFFKKYRNIYLLINILNGRSIISLRLIEYFVVNYVLENNTHYNLTKYRNKPEFIVDNLFTSGPPTIDITQESQTSNGTLSNVDDTKSLKDEIRMSILETKIKNQLTTTDLGPIHLNETFKTTSENFDDYFLVHDNYKCQLKEYNKKNFDPFCRWTRIRMYYDKTKFFFTTVAQLNFFKWAIENYVLDYILDNLSTIEKSMNDYERAIKKEKKIRKLNMLQVNATADNNDTQTSSTPSYINIPNSQMITNTELNIDTSIMENMESSATDVSATNNMTKKVTHTLFSTLDKKSKIKGRKKKEFTKTNRSILKYNCTKIVNFD